MLPPTDATAWRAGIGSTSDVLAVHSGMQQHMGTANIVPSLAANITSALSFAAAH
jgi:hypothetical protein